VSYGPGNQEEEMLAAHFLLAGLLLQLQHQQHLFSSSSHVVSLVLNTIALTLPLFSWFSGCLLREPLHLSLVYCSCLA